MVVKMEVKDVRKVIVKKQKVIFVDKEGNEKAFRKHPIIFALIDAMVRSKIIGLNDVEIND
jgi:hypothetical protein